MPDPELGNRSSQEASEANNEGAVNREQLKGELQQVESDIKKAERERDTLREEFKKANDAEYLARLHLQREQSANPQSVDIGILRDAQRANKALAEMYQRKLDEWNGEKASAYYQLQQKRQQVEGQLGKIAA